MPFTTEVAPVSFKGTRMFAPFTVGRTTLAHRVVMAPLTRMRAHYPGNVPDTVDMPLYYKQRASFPGTMIITEATLVSPEAGGFDNAPGIWSDEQVKAWKPTFDGIRECGSFSWVQLWALGWEADIPSLTRDNLPYVGPSDNIYKSEESKAEALKYKKPIHGLDAVEIQQYIDAFAHAAENSIKAGADGVEIHAANGYLLQQFLDVRANANATIQERAQFTLDIVSAVCKAVGPERVGIRISPFFRSAGMRGSRDNLLIAEYAYLLGKLQENWPTMAYLHVIDPVPRFNPGNETGQPQESNDFVYSVWKGPVIRAGGLGRYPETARKFLQDDRTLLAYGRYFLSTPDLVERLRDGHPLNAYDEDTYYTPGPRGCTDYPTYAEALERGW